MAVVTPGRLDFSAMNSHLTFKMRETMKETQDKEKVAMLKAFMSDNKLTQIGIAAELCVNQGQISRWLSGKQKVPDYIAAFVQCLSREKWITKKLRGE